MNPRHVISFWLSLIILKTLPTEIKQLYRKYEKNKLKLTTLIAHRLFNETCINNNLLPIYTNVRLHDDAVRANGFVTDFRKNLIQHQITSQSNDIANISRYCEELLSELKEKIPSVIKIEALHMFLDRAVSRTRTSLHNKHTNKLQQLYGSPIPSKQHAESVLNLSNTSLDQHMHDVFRYGMNCHLRSKYDLSRKKVELEKFYTQIETEKKKGTITIEDEEGLKCELKRFGLRNIRDYGRDVLTKEQHLLIKEFNNNENIIVRKADKSNTFVIMNKEDYNKKMTDLISNPNKFLKINKDPTDTVKKKLNTIIETINAVGNNLNITKRIGHFTPGYLYGNPKIHKNQHDPPMRPIISQVGTVTYETAKALNDLLKQYIPTKYMISLTQEFMHTLKSTANTGILASLDVESLFTNVPVIETIEIIINRAYNHETLSPPAIPKTSLEQLLLLCTTETPFQDTNGDMYIQVDGVSMGSPLGPLFANFYMAELENNIIPFLKPEESPLVYCRYVDDIFLIVNRKSTINLLKTKFEEASVLQFTYEIEKHNELTFLDVNITHKNNQIETSVHTKSTHSGDINYHSIAPDRYKTGIIKSMLNRAYTISSNWDAFHAEVERLKQMFTNNNFPIKLIDETIKQFLDKKMNGSNEPVNPTNNIQLYYRNQMSQQYKQEEKNLRNIVNNFISPSHDRSLTIAIYYKNTKLRQLFIKNNLHQDTSNSHVVYQYTCPMDGCNPSQIYIGYTTTSLKQRMTAHTQNGGIRTHQQTVHQRKIKTAEILEHTKVLYRNQDKIELQIMEALLIKQHNPPLNNQQLGDTRILHIF